MAKLSVLMGVYREKPEFLRLAVESILGQTYGDFEFFIVLDDPENQRLQKIIEEYAKQDKRIILLINEQNEGLALSLNRAINASTGVYLARMDADDISLSDRFAKQVDYMDTHPDIAVLGTNKIIIDEFGKEVSRGSDLPSSHEGVRETLKYSNIIVHPSVMMRSEVIKSEGGYRAFPTTQDYDLWMRLIDKNYKICNLNEYLIKYRINNSGVSMSKAYKQCVVARYIDKLQKERHETGKDTFSVENLNQFLQDNQVDNPDVCQLYQEARALMEDGRIQIKQRKYITGCIKLIRATNKHPFMRKSVIDQIKSSFVKRKINSHQ